MAEIAVFRAAHDVDPADTRITGPEQHANRSAIVQQLIHARLDADLTRAGADTARWRQLADTIDTHLLDDPFWPRLATHLDDAARAGADVAALLDAGHHRARPAARRNARRGPVVAPCRHPGTPLARTRRHQTATALDRRTAPPVGHPNRRSHRHRPRLARPCRRRRRLRLAPSRPARRGRRPPARHRRHPNACAPTNTPACSPTASNCSPTTPPPSTPTSPTPPNRPKHRLPGPTRPARPTTSTCLTISREPPPDPYDYPYGFVDDDLAGLDIDDLPRRRVAAPGLVDDIDIPALRPAATPPSSTPNNSPTPSCARAAGPPNKPPPPSWPTCTAASTSSAPTSTHWPAPTPCGCTPKTPPNSTTSSSTSSPPPSPPPPPAATTRPPPATNTTAIRSPSKPTRIDTAVHTARTRLDTARADLIDAAGGVDNIVTEHHIHTRRAGRRARRHPSPQRRAPDRPRPRRPAVASRSRGRARLRPKPRPQLRSGRRPASSCAHEIIFLEAASTTSPAALYHPPTDAVADLDETHRTRRGSHHEQPSNRAATADTPRRRQSPPHWLRWQPPPTTTTAVSSPCPPPRPPPITPRQPLRRHHHRHLDDARTQLDSNRSKLPLGSLIVVDDADHLQPEQLRWLAETAAATNTKLVLISTADDRAPAHTLLTVLADNLPSAQHIGTADPTRSQTLTAIQRAEHHLAATSAPSLARNEAVQLLQRRDQLLGRLRDIADTAAHIDAVAARQRDLNRGRDRGPDLNSNLTLPDVV